MGDTQRQEPGLVSAAAQITAARTVQMAVVFALTIPLTRILIRPGEYGVYAHATFLASVLPLFVSAALGKGIVYFLPRALRPERLLRSVAAIQLVAMLVVGGAIALFPATLQLLDPDDHLLIEHRVLIGLIVGASFPYTCAEQVMLARGARRGFAKLLLCVSAALLVGIGGALWLAPEDRVLSWALMGLLAATSVQSLAAFAWMLLPYRPDAGTVRRPVGVRQALGFALPVAGAAGIGLLAARIDGFWVPLFFSEIKGEYFRGAMEPPVIGAVAFTLLSLIAPDLSRHHAGEEIGKVLYLWRRTCRLVAVLTIPIVGAVEAVAPDLFLWVYPDFANGVPVFRWYSALMIVRIFLPQVLMENTGAARRTLLVGGVNLALAVWLTVGLTWLVGWQGAAAAVMLATLFANWVVGGELVRRHLNVRWRDLMDWPALVRLSVTSVAGWLAVEIVMTRSAFADWSHFPRAVFGTLVFGAAFAAASPLTGAVTRADLDALRRVFEPRLRALAIKLRLARA